MLLTNFINNFQNKCFNCKWCTERKVIRRSIISATSDKWFYPITRVKMLRRYVNFKFSFLSFGLNELSIRHLMIVFDLTSLLVKRWSVWSSALLPFAFILPYVHHFRCPSSCVHLIIIWGRSRQSWDSGADSVTSCEHDSSSVCEVACVLKCI